MVAPSNFKKKNKCGQILGIVFLEVCYQVVQLTMALLHFLTAYALMQTKDENAHKYPEKTVQTFNGGGKIFLINMLILLLFINFVSQNYERNILIKEMFHFV